MEQTQLAVKCRLTAYSAAFEKRPAGTKKADTVEGRKIQGNQAGAACTEGGIVVELTAEELATHSGTGKATAVGVYANSYRLGANVIEQNLIGLDFENGGMTYDDILNDAFIMAYAAVVMPTANNTPDDPRYRVFIFLDRSATYGEVQAILKVFYSKYAGKLDTKASDGARLFFGAAMWEQYRNECWYDDQGHVLKVDDFMREHGCVVELPTASLSKTASRGTATPNCVASDEPPPTDTRILKIYYALEKILKWHADRGIAIGSANDLSFNKLVWSAAVATNRDPATKALLRNDPSWQLVKATPADYTRFDRNFDDTPVHSLSAGYIFFWAGQLC